MKIEIIKSADGSHTLYREDIDETYHSRHGSIQEAQHVFIKNGLHHVWNDKEGVNVLEVGFGTGLNALLTLIEAIKNQKQVFYTGVEAIPVPLDITSVLNYSNLLELDITEKESFEILHSADWNENVTIDDHFVLNKIESTIQKFSTDIKYDLIYFDAFGPNSQSEMWEKDVFRIVYNALKPNGVLVTYCAKGQVRRDLESIGFKMERLPGPPGKREMLRGTKLP